MFAEFITSFFLFYFIFHIADSPWKEDMNRDRSTGGIQCPTIAYIAGHVKPWNKSIDVTIYTNNYQLVYYKSLSAWYLIKFFVFHFHLY